MTLLEFLIIVVAVGIPTVLLVQSRKFGKDLEADWNSLWQRYNRVSTELANEKDRAESFLFRMKREQERCVELLEDLSKWKDEYTELLVILDEMKKQNELLLSARSDSFKECGGFPEPDLKRAEEILQNMEEVPVLPPDY